MTSGRAGQTKCKTATAETLAAATAFKAAANNAAAEATICGKARVRNIIYEHLSKTRQHNEGLPVQTK